MAKMSVHLGAGFLAGGASSICFFAYPHCGPNLFGCGSSGNETLLMVVSAILGAGFGAAPDVDAPQGKVVRILVFCAAALAFLYALYSLFAAGRMTLAVLALTILAALGAYAAVVWALTRMMKHRGMFHSLPMAVAAAAWTGVFLRCTGWFSESGIFELCVCGAFAGWVSHLLLDALCSVSRGGLSMFKLWSESGRATAAAYLAMGTGLALNFEPVRHWAASIS